VETLTAEEVLASFDGVKTVAICSHVNPDGDAVGSTLALAALMRALGCETTCLLAQNRPAPFMYSFLEDYDFLSASDYTETPDLFIAVDLSGTGRLGNGCAVLERAPRSLCIDHHPGYTGYADAYFGDIDAAATASLIWELIKKSGVSITPAMASYCYVAIMTDTGRFSYQNTNERTFYDAAEMVASGVNPTYISKQVYESKSMALLRLEVRLIERMRFSRNREIVYSWIDDNDFVELGVNCDDTESLPIILRSLAGVQVAALLRAEDDVVRVNLRSRGCCDVAELASRFGGGGHRAASGFTFNKSLEETIAILLEAFERSECLELKAGGRNGCLGDES